MPERLLEMEALLGPVDGAQHERLPRSARRPVAGQPPTAVGEHGAEDGEDHPAAERVEQGGDLAAQMTMLAGILFGGRRRNFDRFRRPYQRHSIDRKCGDRFGAGRASGEAHHHHQREREQEERKSPERHHAPSPAGRDNAWRAASRAVAALHDYLNGGGESGGQCKPSRLWARNVIVEQAEEDCHLRWRRTAERQGRGRESRGRVPVEGERQGATRLAALRPAITGTRS